MALIEVLAGTRRVSKHGPYRGGSWYSARCTVSIVWYLNTAPVELVDGTWRVVLCL